MSGTNFACSGCNPSDPKTLIPSSAPPPPAGNSQKPIPRDRTLDENTDDTTSDSKKEVKSKETVEKTKSKMNAGKEKALDEEQKLDGNVFHTSLYDNLMQDIDAGNWEKATNMILALVTVDDMLKLLSEEQILSR